MPTATEILLLGVAALFLLWLLYHRLRRRLSLGRATEVERRFDVALQRFNVEIDRFKFTRQGAVKILMNHDHAIWTSVEEMALAGEGDREELRLRVHRYTEEIVPFFKPLSYYGFGYLLAGSLLKMLYRIDFRPEEVERLKLFSKEKPRSVIYLMNHRSNVDYILAAYVLAERLALSFAVGEWARVWPLESLFKSFGSYFLRRGFRDPLYHMVLRRYVQLVTKNSVTQALFPEGGLSRDGRLRAPKIGLLDSIICSKEDRSFNRELIFVPVSVNYDRVLEDRALTRELQDKRPPRNKAKTALHVGRALFGNAWKFSRRRIRKNGIAAVRFGEPISFDEWHSKLGVDIFALPKEDRRAHVSRFCDLMMQKIAEKIPATPLCVVAKTLVDHAPLSYPTLLHEVAAEINALKKLGVEIVGDEKGVNWMVDGALLRFELRHLLERDGDRISVKDECESLFRYYANSLAHYYDDIVPTVQTPRSNNS